MARTPAPGAQVSGTVLRGDVTARDFADALDALGGLNPGRAVILVALAPPAPVSAAVVDLVVDELLARGADSVTVGAGRGVSAHALAAGLTGHTARGRTYDVIDVHDSLGTADLPVGSVLHGRPVSLAWSGATTRVVLARSVTDLAEGYGGALATLATIAAEVPGADPAEVAADLADHLAPHLCIIDATISSDGPDGRHQLRPADTGALVVGLDPLVVDATLAGLHGIDRAVSRPVAELLRRRGPPTGEVSGDLTPFDAFERPHPLIRDAWRRAEQAPGIGRVLAAARAGRGRGAELGQGAAGAVAHHDHRRGVEPVGRAVGPHPL
ncbi:MAG TPA: DUF362 domain-containing protein, partial [Candidatus Lustribacter sp.]|nr:DUF362 domain-containing protein [Candidatus Lustribacter sp.]